MAYESFYEGVPYSLEPVYKAGAGYGDVFTGYRSSFKTIGAPTSIQTANQIQEVSNLLNQGVKHIELQPLSEGVFDQIPKQHFKEIARLQKMAGAETSVHAPFIEPSGFGREGWNEQDWKAAEQQLNSVIDRVQDLNPKGGMPIVVHASAIQGSEETPVSDKLKKEYIEGYKSGHHGNAPTKEELDNLKYKRIIAINQDTKQLIPAEREERIYPDDVAGIAPGEIAKPLIRTPMEELDIHNKSDWHQNLTQVIFYKNRGDDIIAKEYGKVRHIWPYYFTNQLSEEEFKKLPDTTRAALLEIRGAYEYVQQSQLTLNSLFSKAYKYGNDKEKEILRKAAVEYEEKIGNPKTGVHIDIQSEAIQDLAIAMEKVNPKVFVPIEQFATDKSATTFANAAWHAFNENKKNPPIIAIENLYPGMAFSRSEQLKGLIEASRKKFEDQAVNNGYTREEGKKIAERMIGATWDVGHLNMQRKSGFSEKELIKETENIAPYVKHVHLTDNFGYSDSHLPPGMGNVPIKKIMDELEGQGFTGKKVVEAGAFAQHFRISPTQATLEALGSPLYTMMQAPYWNQTLAIPGEYFSGYGPILPEQHFSMYGTGFSGMPVELGGQMPGKTSRVSGTPME